MRDARNEFSKMSQQYLALWEVLDLIVSKVGSEFAGGLQDLLDMRWLRNAPRETDVETAWREVAQAWEENFPRTVRGSEEAWQDYQRVERIVGDYHKLEPPKARNLLDTVLETRAEIGEKALLFTRRLAVDSRG